MSTPSRNWISGYEIISQGILSITQLRDAISRGFLTPHEPLKDRPAVDIRTLMKLINDKIEEGGDQEFEHLHSLFRYIKEYPLEAKPRRDEDIPMLEYFGFPEHVTRDFSDDNELLSCNFRMEDILNIHKDDSSTIKVNRSLIAGKGLQSAVVALRENNYPDEVIAHVLYEHKGGKEKRKIGEAIRGDDGGYHDPKYFTRHLQKLLAKASKLKITIAG